MGQREGPETQVTCSVRNCSQYVLNCFDHRENHHLTDSIFLLLLVQNCAEGFNVFWLIVKLLVVIITHLGFVLVALMGYHVVDWLCKKHRRD